MAHGIGYRLKKLLIAAARAAKGRGDPPPQLWKAQVATPPTWSEFDAMDYRSMVEMVAVQNVYNVVKAFAGGHAAKDPEIMKAYTRLVADGIAGKEVK